MWPLGVVGISLFAHTVCNPAQHIDSSLDQHPPLVPLEAQSTTEVDRDL